MVERGLNTVINRDQERLIHDSLIKGGNCEKDIYHPFDRDIRNIAGLFLSPALSAACWTDRNDKDSSENSDSD
jgi:hypothetical protein